MLEGESLTRRHPAGTTQGGQFAPGASPDSPAAPDGLALAAAASEIDALAARAAVTVGEWELSNLDKPRQDQHSDFYRSANCKTTVGPFAGVPVTLMVSFGYPGEWRAEVVTTDGGDPDYWWVEQPGAHLGARSGWADSTDAMAALEAVLAATPEADRLFVTMMGPSSKMGDAYEWVTWDWQKKRWASGTDTSPVQPVNARP